MNKVNVKKSELLAILKKNKSEHRQIFEEALVKFHEASIDEMDRQLARARKGEPFVMSRFVELVQPQDYTIHYERAIKMLEMSVDDTIEISATEFSNYVEDVWNWSRGWAESNINYVDSPKLQMLRNARKSEKTLRKILNDDYYYYLNS